jgi:hypothetical protein
MDTNSQDTQAEFETCFDCCAGATPCGADANPQDTQAEVEACFDCCAGATPCGADAS